MTSDVTDEVVEKEILGAIDSLKVSIRPNKLRKIICKQIDGTNWTQFQRVLDTLLEGKKLKNEVVDSEMMIVPSNACENQEKKEEPKDLPDVKKLTDSTKVPLAIIRHLVRKGHKKQNNIEKNSKTKISFSKEGLRAINTKTIDQGNKFDLTISKEYDGNEDEELAKKQLKTALLMITKMVQAYKEKPDRFARKEAGGSLEYQQKVKKQKIEIEKKRGRKIGGEDDNKPKSRKKRKRKYY